MPREKLGRLRCRASIWKVHDCEAERQLVNARLRLMSILGHDQNLEAHSDDVAFLSLSGCLAA
jgi:hypothetical protein